MEIMKDMECESGQVDCPDVSEVPGEVLLPLVVLRKILENLSSADCLNLSRVNRVWNYEARSVLRDRCSLTVNMNTSDGTCKDMRDFASDLRRMREGRKILPFSGLTIAMRGDCAYQSNWFEESSTGELDQAYEDILHHMEWKHLVLDLTHGWYREENCAGFMLIKKILHHCSFIIEEFSLKIAYHHEAFTQHFLQDCKFTHLKTLKFQGRSCGGDEDLIKALVSRSPNLKVLDTKGRVNLRANLLEGSAAVHFADNPYYGHHGGDDEIPESIVGQLRLRQLRLTLSDSQNFNFERLNRMVPVLLQQSRTTLSSMLVDSVRLVALMHSGICLKNVKELVVGFYAFDASQPRARLLLRTFDFNRIFPNLRSVRIFCYVRTIPNLEHTWNAVIDMVEQRNAALIEPVNRSENIRQLNLSWCPTTQDASVRFLVKMFPHIEKIVIVASNVPFVRFWDYWLDLEELDITLLFMSIRDLFENLDSAICGIFPEEVAELRERDEEYLQSVNIVPVMPCLSSLKRLRTLTLHFGGSRFLNVDPKPELSKVTGLIAFKRRPGLTVKLETNSDRWKRALQHMEPYASVRLTHRYRI